jgi:hypothetical protein
MQDGVESSQLIAALERFVVENDDLLELEERIGRFNIFDALGIARAEIRHSNFLAWLLDPNESHGQGSLFLKALLMDLLRHAPLEKRPLSPVELDGEELRGVEIRREWRNIDLVIACQQPAFVIAVENKTAFGMSDSQSKLQRYKDAVAAEFSGLPAMHVFLTPDGSEAAHEDWVPYAFGDIHRVLTRCRNTSAGAIGDDAGAFLDHYLRLIGSRFMNDPKIDELCKRIYRNHRQALELIVERAGGASLAMEAIAETIRERQPAWTVLNLTGKQANFIPTAWGNFLPPIAQVSKTSPRSPQVWLKCEFILKRSKCWFRVVACPTTDPQTRKRVINRLVQDQKEFGFKSTYGEKVYDQWTRLRSEEIAAWDEEGDANVEALKNAVAKKLDAILPTLELVPPAVKLLLSS